MNKFADAYNLLKDASLKTGRTFTVHEFSGNTIHIGKYAAPLRYIRVGISFLDKTEADLFAEMRDLETTFYDIAADGAEKVLVFSPTAGLWYIKDQTINVALAFVAQYADGSVAVLEANKMRLLNDI